MKISLSALLCLLLSAASLANEQCKTLTAGCGYGWFPVAFVTSQDRTQSSGIVVEALRKAAQEQGIEIQFNCQMPWKRALRYMDEGSIDIIAGHYLTEQRQQKWLISKALFNEEIAAFAHKDTVADLPNIESLNPRTGVVPAGASYGSDIDARIAQQLTVVEFKDKFNMIGGVVKKRFDYAILAKLDGEYYLKRLGIDFLVKKADFSLGKNSVHFGFSKRSPCKHLFKQFDQRVQAYFKAGYFDDFAQTAANNYQGVTPDQMQWFKELMAHDE